MTRVAAWRDESSFDNPLGLTVKQNNVGQPLRASKYLNVLYGTTHMRLLHRCQTIRTFFFPKLTT